MNYPFITKNIKTDLAILNICELFDDYLPINTIHAGTIFSWPGNVPFSYRNYYSYEYALVLINISIKVI